MLGFDGDGRETFLVAKPLAWNTLAQLVLICFLLKDIA